MYYGTFIGAVFVIKHLISPRVVKIHETILEVKNAKNNIEIMSVQWKDFLALKVSRCEFSDSN